LLAAQEGRDAAGVELLKSTTLLARSATGLDVRNGDIATEAVFEPGSFAVVTLWGVLEHVRHPDVLLRAAASLLAPGGHVLLETPSPLGAFQRLASLVLRLSGGRVVRPATETIKAGHVAWLGAGASLRPQLRSD
jgi:2-polyprenyl-3-methyl-5-hydroxy-6-metoxy-1,4-benzoquinol methylase